VDYGFIFHLRTILGSKFPFFLDAPKSSIPFREMGRAMLRRPHWDLAGAGVDAYG
jgi:hypothetical protein